MPAGARDLCRRAARRGPEGGPDSRPAKLIRMIGAGKPPPLTDGWTENRPSRGFHRVGWAEVWSYRELVGLLASRDVRSHYKQTALGIAWALAKPLFGTLTLLLVFRRFIAVASDGVPYILFAFVGFAFWTYVSDGVTSVTGSLLNNSELITKVYFPRVALPLAALVAGLVDFVLSFILLGVLMAISGFMPRATIVLLPLCLVFAMAIVFGFGVLLATINVLYRDVSHGVGLLIQLWFFVSPVGYPSSLIDADWRHVYSINPVVGLLDLARWTVLGTPLSALDLGISLASTTVVAVLGFGLFQLLERRFADVI